MALPGLVLVHGGAHAGDCWDLTVDEIRRRFDAEVERFSNLETGQSATIDAPLSLACIRAGKRVLCEKPAALSAATVSPPPATEISFPALVRSAACLAETMVPRSNGVISNAPSGPFQTSVAASSIAA